MENNIQENKVSILYNPEILLDPSKNYSCQENWNEDRLNALIGMIKSLDVFKNTTMNVIISNMKEDDFPQGLFGDQKIAYYPDLNEDLATFLKRKINSVCNMKRAKKVTLFHVIFGKFLFLQLKASLVLKFIRKR
ncbi:MAG: hypothetical protein Q4B64_02705 [Spirochaetales bacterium]|nr:hypothetical protein [Spirochaetales bacterium]